MPTAALRPCAQPGCPALVERGRCAKHQRMVEQRRGSSAQRGYGGDWQARRRAYLKDAGFRQVGAGHPPATSSADGGLTAWCLECLAQGHLIEATEVDHIIPKARGGADDESNFQPLCKRCHSAKTIRELVRQ